MVIVGQPLLVCQLLEGLLKLLLVGGFAVEFWVVLHEADALALHRGRDDGRGLPLDSLRFIQGL